MLLEGGAFPQQAAGGSASLGDIESGASLYLRNLTAYKGESELQPTAESGLTAGSANLPGLCPPYTTQTSYWKVKGNQEVVRDDNGCFTCTGFQCTPECFRTTMWGVQCGSCADSLVEPGLWMSIQIAMRASVTTATLIRISQQCTKQLLDRRHRQRTGVGTASSSSSQMGKFILGQNLNYLVLIEYF